MPLLGDAVVSWLGPLIGRLAWRAALRRIFSPQPVPASWRAFPRRLALTPGALQSSARETALMIPAAANLAGRYARIEAPTTIVAGDADRMVDTGGSRCACTGRWRAAGW